MPKPAVTVKELPLGLLRRASVEDAPQVLSLLTESISETFRVYCTYDITRLIENGVLCICQLDPYDDVIGFLGARDFPLLPSVHPCAWEEYLWTKYKTPEMNSRNTLFIHLLCWDDRYQRPLVDNMLKSIFMHDAYILHIALLKSVIRFPQLMQGQSRSEASFRRVTVVERGTVGDKLPVLCIADRSEVCPRLKIRRAVEEDNDDLVPILEQHSERLRELYGDFYISELISRHPDSDRVLLVCEHSELAVGVMCIDTKINYEALEESYVLLPFGGLKHVDKVQKDMIPRVESTNSLAGIPDLLSKTKEKDTIHDTKSRVTWIFEDNVDNGYQSVLLPVVKEEEDPILDVRLLRDEQSFLDLFEDEEDIEFDIVNIDHHLLRVPELLIYDDTGDGPADSVLKVLNGPTKNIPDKKVEIKPKRIPATSGASVFEKPKIVRYSGKPNAFLLELFAIHPDYDERYGFDMLEVAFEMFPGRDYCVLCLPTNQPAFPLIEHFTLVTPHGGKERFLNESLYVAHVNSVRGRMSVRLGEACDEAHLKNVMEYAPRIDKLMDLFRSTLNSYSLQSFTLLSENQPVGFVVLGPLHNGTAIRAHYDLEPEPRRPGSDAMILAGILSPVFEPHARWFMRELIRLSRYATLFWICKLYAKADAAPSRNLMSLASHMNPVQPRMVLPNITGSKELDKVYQALGSPFALWVCERPITCLPKVNINNSIVVVGASRTGLAFLETLLMGPASSYLTFSNVTLVSENGLPDVDVDCLKAADTCVPKDGRYNDRYLKSMPFYYYLDIITSVIAKIDRKRKCIYFKSGGFKKYDELVLTCGKQFQHPDYLNEAIGLAKEVAKGKPCDRILMDNPNYKPDTVPTPPELPENVFLINSLFEANICLRKLRRMISEAKDDLSLSNSNQVIVYGDCVEAYCCIAALLELGLSPEMIVFVEPFPSIEEPAPLRVNCFNDETIDKRVQDTVEKLGIRVLRQCQLSAWHQLGNRVEYLNFMAPLTSIQIRSFALFYYGLCAINVHAFKAINESGLVYDGGLVVGATFETNDPCIFGAGPCVRYSRRLYANRSRHRFYCSEDIGEALAKLFLHRMDPFIMGDPDLGQVPSGLIPKYSSSVLGFGSKSSTTSIIQLPVVHTRRTFEDDLEALRKAKASTKKLLAGLDPSVKKELDARRREKQLSRSLLPDAPPRKRQKWQPVMKFESPIVQFAILPGPLYYLKLRKPGQEIPMAIQQCLPRQGHNLITDMNQNYFCVHLNVLHMVDAVTCLSHVPFAPELFQQLYGKHEAFFNNLLNRYQKGQIYDLYDFFTQPWMSAVYQESFQDLICNIKEQDVGTIKDLVKSKFALFDAVLEEEEEDEVVLDAVDTQKSVKSTQSITATFRTVSRRQGNILNVIDKYATQEEFSKCVREHTGIPSECGQSEDLRLRAAKFWRKAGCERIVKAHVSQYLDKYSVTHPHFALPKLP